MTLHEGYPGSAGDDAAATAWTGLWVVASRLQPGPHFTDPGVESVSGVGFGSHWFYCHARVGPSAPVNHLVPCSRVGLVGLANLMLACLGCNGDKGLTLPAPALVEAAAGAQAHRARATGRRAVLADAVQPDGPPLLAAATGASRQAAPSRSAGTKAAAVDFVGPDDSQLVS